jgi:hypothetical protein
VGAQVGFRSYWQARQVRDGSDIFWLECGLLEKFPIVRHVDGRMLQEWPKLAEGACLELCRRSPLEVAQTLQLRPGATTAQALIQREDHVRHEPGVQPVLPSLAWPT